MSNGIDLIPAALYARVSSDRQDVDLSVAAQMRALRDYAERNGYSVAREYVDEAESGRIADRPQFRRMLDEASKPEAPFKEILVWKFSRFTRKREHAVAFKSMLRRKGVRVVSITEHADDSPTGKLMEAIIESVDEFYSENLAEEVRRGMREAASRGFWVASRVPYGYRKLMVQDGAKKRPTLEPNPDTSPVVKRIFDMAEAGHGILDITRTLNDEGIANPTGRPWSKNGVHIILKNEAYTGTLLWGGGARDKGDPVRVEKAFPALVTKTQFRKVNKQMSSRAPRKAHPRRVGSSYLLSGLVKCRACERAMSGQDSKGGQFAYYVCQSLMKRGSGACDCPEAERKALRGDGGGEDSGERAHRVQHPGAGQAGGRGDGRHRPGAAPAAGDRRGGAGRREAAGWSGSTTWRRPPTWTSRTSSPASGTTGSARKSLWRRRRRPGCCCPSGGWCWTMWRPLPPTART